MSQQVDISNYHFCDRLLIIIMGCDCCSAVGKGNVPPMFYIWIIWHFMQQFTAGVPPNVSLPESFQRFRRPITTDTTQKLGILKDSSKSRMETSMA